MIYLFKYSKHCTALSIRHVHNGYPLQIRAQGVVYNQQMSDLQDSLKLHTAAQQ